MISTKAHQTACCRLHRVAVSHTVIKIRLINFWYFETLVNLLKERILTSPATTDFVLLFSGMSFVMHESNTDITAS